MANSASPTTKSSQKKQEQKPLTFPSPSPAFLLDEEVAVSSQYLDKRRGLFWCCGCCGALVIILGLILLILSFTLFKVKDPELTLNNLYLDGVNPGFRDFKDPLSLNATLTADISIKNPNVASYKFDSSTTEFYYKGQTVGIGYAPSGGVRARRTLRMNMTVNVLLDKVANATGAGALVGGTVNITSFTDIDGKVNVFGIYKRDIEMMLNCSMIMDVSLTNQEVHDKVCVASVS